jgi:hypothetical protein
MDGIWLRAPYLHNGSVPNMHDLLEPAERRTKIFYRGYDVYDPVNMGLIQRVRRRSSSAGDWIRANAGTGIRATFMERIFL